MRITRISVYRAELPVPGEGYRLSGGRIFRSLDSTLVALETDQGGHLGWGESCPFGSIYLPAHALGVRAGIAELAPHLLGLDPTRPERVNEVMDAVLPGHPHAKSAVDLACWDLFGKAVGRPVCDLLGGRTEGAIGLISSVSCEPPEAMAANVARFRAEGYRAHSIKVGSTPEEDLARIRAVLAERRPGEAFQVDVNRGWTPDTALRVLAGLGNADVVIEQPCATYRECRAVKAHTNLPVMLDEIVSDAETLLEVIRDDAADAFNLKIARVGGLTKGRHLRDICASAGLALSIQDTGGAEVAFAAIVHLAQSTPRRVLREVWDPRELSTLALADGAPEIADGAVSAPERPGLGVSPRMEVLGEPVAVYG
jgi:L-alanine-DL-glutamate epimerase-like enolase superfamily enzyme